jgi:uncharacterized protein (TIGR00299 family) protein
MRAVYFDCFAGAAGDMIVAALIGLGVDPQELEAGLATLDLGGYQLETGLVNRSGVSAVRFDVRASERHQPERGLNEVRAIITGSSLPPPVKDRAMLVFERLAAAEARIHDTTPDKVHFHEVGAVDSIIDVVGAAFGLERLGIERVYASPLRLGFGIVQTAHGRLPVPAPATAELLRGIPVYAGDLEGEYTTPTAAAILSALCDYFGVLPAGRIERVGYGAGARNPEGFPNALRAMLGEFPEVEPRARSAPESIYVVEASIDDMSPQAYEPVMERAFALGALDVFLTPIQMKKNRPGVVLTVLCEPGRLDAIARLLLTETTTFGIRYHQARRQVLARRIETVETPFGAVRVKVAVEGSRALHFQPEYDDCLRLANEHGAPFLEVQAAAASAYRARLDVADGESLNGELEKD